MKNKKRSLIAIRRWEKHIFVSDELHSILDGLIMGDAHIHQGTHQSFLSISASAKHEDFILHLKDISEKSNLNCKVSKCYSGYRTPNGDKRKFTSYNLRTVSYVELNKFHQRWYKGRKKVIPKDIKLDRLSLLYWYLGDGALKHRGSSGAVEFGTYGFCLDDIKRVAWQICKILNVYPTQVRIYKLKAGFIINLAPPTIKKFFEIINPSPAESFDYKWDLSNFEYIESNYLLK